MEIKHKPSIEQKDIINNISEMTKCVVVDAVAGSGKTTTIIFIAKQCIKQRILVITYSKRLKEDSRRKKELYGLNNIEIHSYHSFCVKYYDGACINDDKMVNVFNKKPKVRFKFDMIILDEIQDMTPMYFRLICKILTDNFYRPIIFNDVINKEKENINEVKDTTNTTKEKNNVDDITTNTTKEKNNVDDITTNTTKEKNNVDEVGNITTGTINKKENINEVGNITINATKEKENVDGVGNTNKNIILCVLGDRYQSIFEYKGADNRFIIYAGKVFSFFKEWKYLTLYESFRVTEKNADFINNCMLNDMRIRSKQPGPKPRYIIGSDQDIIKEINNYLYKLECKPEDIFILSPSVRTYGCKKIANKISKSGINIYVPSSDDSAISTDLVMKGKISFITFHQSKGLERSVIIVLNFGSSYYEYFAKNEDPNMCSNALYVASTRSSKYISYFREKKDKPFKWIDENKVKIYTEMYKNGILQ